MIRSMTAFGRSVISTSFGIFHLEISSVNKKTLDISTYIPKDFLFFEMAFRKWIQKIVSRGSITIRLYRESQPTGEVGMMNREDLVRFKDKLDAMASDFGLERVQSIESLLECAQKYGARKDSDQTEALEKELQKAFEEASQHWLEMKYDEGKLLQKDFHERLERMSSHLCSVEGMVSRAPETYAQRLKKRLDEAGVLEEMEDDRVIKEVVIFSEKVDTTEEIVRLKSHVEQFGQTIDNDQHVVGRKLDFILQEMNREANSLSVKCQDLDIVKLCLELKSEIEKIREQVQNIE